ncbi:MAG: peptidase [Sphingomonadales bacterium BRH_c42]|nr:MAG: peptidase [Sphingomonadales bacterium BRH_c42]
MSNTVPKILLVVGGGIAAYKACELVRLVRKGGGDVTCVVTDGGQQFVTPMALAALSENPVYTTLWDLKNEAEIGHIQLSREADLVVVCPATADLLAKMAAGIADDLATTLILATDKPVMAVPAMNVRMWEHEATQRNIAWLRQAGVEVLDPDQGAMACGEFGYGRLPEPEVIWAAIGAHLGIEVDLPAPAPAPTPAAAGEPAGEPADTPADEPAVQGIEVEAIEAEPEPESRLSSLGSLLSSIIPRSTPKRSAEELEAEYLEQADAEGTGDEEIAEPGEPEAVPDLGGPLLAKKGGASSAPPTDPAAMNHLVKTGAGTAPPEPIDGEPAMPDAIEERIEDALGGEQFAVAKGHRPLKGRHILVTAGPTWEAIDPVRYIANRSSGKQGFAIAAAAAALGAKVTLVAGPVSLITPKGVERVNVESANDMADVVRQTLPVDVAIMVAAVADWRPKEYRGDKMKKRGSAPPALILEENPDILTNVAASDKRPALVVGFAAETENVLEHAKQKRKRKAADWIVANDVSGPKGKGVMGGDTNRVHIVTGNGIESLDEMPKLEVAIALLERVATALKEAEDA